MRIKESHFIASFFIIILIISGGIDNIYAADKKPAMGSVAVFYVPQRDLQLDALSEKSAKMVMTVFDSLGRFLPTERNRVIKAMEKVTGTKSKGDEATGDAVISDEDDFKELADALEVDIYVIISVMRRNKSFYSQIKIIPRDERNRSLRKIITANSAMINAIPLKLGREIAYLHEGLKLSVTEINPIKEMHIINAGQWHGLTTGIYKTDDGKKVRIVKIDRFYSLAIVEAELVKRGSFELMSYPDSQKIVKQLNGELEHTIDYKYGLHNTLLKGADVEKKYLEGVCVINPGANACIPGYGAHLATRYLGFQDVSPSIPGIVVTCALFLTHLTLTESMTAFQTNFFPGIKDSDKTWGIYNLQIFLWSTLPVTATIGFLDQLAHQFKATEHLPPYFENRDVAALCMSAFIPGGGLFFKGYRLAGWAYYFAEMALLGYGTYVYDQKNRNNNYMYAFIAVGVVKLAEIFNAYFIKSSYAFYNNEKNRGTDRNPVSFNITPPAGNGLALGFSVSYGF